MAGLSAPGITPAWTPGRLRRTLIRPPIKRVSGAGSLDTFSRKRENGSLGLLLIIAGTLAGHVTANACRGIRKFHATAFRSSMARADNLPDTTAMTRSLLLLLACALLPACAQQPVAQAAPATSEDRPGVTGRLLHHEQFPSRYVAARNVDVWLPPGYDADGATRYPVVYMHDGQNLFYPKHSYTGDEWGVDEVMTGLIAGGDIRPAIVVGVWNTPARVGEYMPRKAVLTDTIATGVEGFAPVPRGDVVSDRYLRFLVEELKPFVDAHYRTLPGRDDTFVMGSSMGGMISAYAIAEYPEVFGGAAALSTHWPACDGCVVDWLAAHLPDPRTHRIYFDHGTRTLDAAYAPYQQRMDAAMREHGYVAGANWISRVFDGDAHEEKSWRARFHVPLRFLLPRE